MTSTGSSCKAARRSNGSSGLARANTFDMPPLRGALEGPEARPGAGRVRRRGLRLRLGSTGRVADGYDPLMFARAVKTRGGDRAARARQRAQTRQRPDGRLFPGRTARPGATSTALRAGGGRPRRLRADPAAWCGAIRAGTTRRSCCRRTRERRGIRRHARDVRLPWHARLYCWDGARPWVVNASRGRREALLPPRTRPLPQTCSKPSAGRPGEPTPGAGARDLPQGRVSGPCRCGGSSSRARVCLTWTSSSGLPTASRTATGRSSGHGARCTSVSGRERERWWVEEVVVIGQGWRASAVSRGGSGR